MSRETLRARLAAATPGPWKHRRGYPADRFHPEGYGYVQFGPTEAKADGRGTDQLAKADAEFIAHARVDLAALLAVADAAAALVAGTAGVYDGGYCLDCHGLAEDGHSEDCSVPTLQAALAALESQP